MGPMTLGGNTQNRSGDLLGAELSVLGQVERLTLKLLINSSGCPLHPIFDVETENAGFRSSKIRFAELRVENGPKIADFGRF